MNSSPKAQSATSLPSAPRDDESRRSTRYLILMGVRILCFILMVVITPYGWYTWVLGAGAVFIPYFAMIIANVGSDMHAAEAIAPERALTAAPTAPTVSPHAPSVLRIEETRVILPRDDSSTRA